MALVDVPQQLPDTLLQSTHIRHQTTLPSAVPTDLGTSSEHVLIDGPASDGETEEEDDDADEEGPHERPLTERQRLHASILSQFISENAWKKDTNRERASVNSNNLLDEELSINDLMTRKTDKKIIETPRDYQMELFERAKQKNTIAVLDTGSGKTLIAALLIRWMFDQELEHRRAGRKPKIMFFVVGSVALTFQQYGMLSCNLDQRLQQLYGDMNVDQFTQAHWGKVMKKSMGVVCTAEILYQCLTKGFIKIENINLLIFDEAHHAKKNHSFAKIMTQQYHGTPVEKRPRIFGMTASPCDAKSDVVKAAEDLEKTLDAQIATTRDTTMLRNNVSRPKECVVYYRGSGNVVRPTELTLKLKECFNNSALFQKLAKQANEFRKQIGDWCCDRYWELCFREEAGEKVEHEYKRLVKKSGNIASLEAQNEATAQIKHAREIVCKHPFVEPTDADEALWTDKVEKLRRYLDTKFSADNSSRCIIFVEHRTIAFLLSDLFKSMGPEFLRPAPMVGTRKTEVGEIAYSLRTQIQTLSKFEKGKLNCILATTIAEEGLDVADCNIIVRFDLYKTMIQYVQSRGRARHHDSEYIHMLEGGSIAHEELLHLSRDSENTMRRFCEALKDDRLLSGNEDGVELLEDKEYRRHVEKETGAALDFHSCLVVLHHYIDVLSGSKDVMPGIQLQPTYLMSVLGNKFVCELLLPEPSPIRSIMGKPYPRKALAKRSAAFIACRQLRKAGHLDQHLMPTVEKYVNKMRNAQLAVSETKKQSYDMIAKPRFWERSWGKEARQLYVTILNYAASDVCGRPHGPIAFFSREKLPHIPSYAVYPTPETETEAICTQLIDVLSPQSLARSGAKPGDAAAEFRGIVTKLTKFTLRVFKDLFNKQFEYDERAMSYWLAPLEPNTSVSPEMNVLSAIDWAALDYVCENEDPLKWDPDTDLKKWQGCLLLDPLSGGRRYFFEHFAPEYKPSDKPPPGVRTTKLALKNMSTIAGYTCSLYGKSRAGFLERLGPQTVIKAYALRHKRNLLEPWSVTDMVDDSKNDVSKTLAYVCVEQLYRSPIPPAAAMLLWNLASFMIRIESHLIAQEACEKLGLTITPALSLEALTKDSDNSHEHSEQQINLRRGMGRNYERLEFIGDCFLKMGTSIALYTRNANDDEFESHVKRMLMICNKNLYNHAVRDELKLYEYIRVQDLRRKTWYPEGLKLLNKGSLKVKNKADTRRLSDKTIADVCEALIGAALLTHEDTQNMDEAVRAVTVMVRNPEHEFNSWADYYANYQMPEFQTRVPDAFQEELAKQCVKKHAYKFNYPRLLYCAFKHPSHPFSFDQMPNYQRLEFLGDALYDQVCVNFLYARHTDKNPQWLTEHKMAMVSNQFLGFVCVKLAFNVHLRQNQGDLIVKTKKYIDSLHTLGNGCLPRAPNAWMDAADPPKCLADMVEAYMGALFVDSRYDFREIERFFDNHIREHFTDMSIYDDFARGHPVTRMQNLLHEDFHCSDFSLVGQAVPKAPGELGPQYHIYAIFIHGKIVKTHKCTSTRYGKPTLCGNFTKEVLEQEGETGEVERLSIEAYRAKFGCNCAVRLEKGLGPVIPPSAQIPSAI